MSTEKNKALSRRFREELDKGNWTVVDEFVSPNAVTHLPGSPPLDREGIHQVFKLFYDAFPDLHHTFEDLIAEGDKVTLRFTFNGTHQGEFQGIPPTGKSITVSAIGIDRIVDGKLVEHWSSFDALGMMQQLGVIPTPEQAGS